ncbi:MAG: prepilin peptidase [Lachnospiraceae bacterium]|nr:prepilin peptidase [Lachnospiraceae bacterium]
MVLLFIFLITGTISDLRSRSIPVLLFIIFGMTGVTEYIISGDRSLMNEAFGVILGVVFIAISVISESKLGMGDALAVLVTGIYLGGSEAACAVLYAMLMTALFSVIILALRKGNRTTALPFLPFLLAGCTLQQVILEANL